LGTAPLFVYAQTLCPKLCPMHPIFAYCPLIQSLQPIDTSRHLVKRGDLQTSSLGPLGYRAVPDNSATCCHGTTFYARLAAKFAAKFGPSLLVTGVSKMLRHGICRLPLRSP